MDAATDYVAPKNCAVVDERERERREGKSAPPTSLVEALTFVPIAELRVPLDNSGVCSYGDVCYGPVGAGQRRRSPVRILDALRIRSAIARSLQ